MYLSSDSESSHGEESYNSSAQRKREAKAKEKFESKLYKPTGPDGRGWGDFREVTKEEQITLEELQRIEERNLKRQEKLHAVEAMKQTKIQAPVTIEDEHTRWERQLLEKQARDKENDKRIQKELLRSQMEMLKQLIS